jgi:tryptophan-rich sensory protein
MSQTARTGWRRDILLALVPLLAVVTASVLGQLATFPNLAPWYVGLIKPSFNPPNWIFGPAWTTLYLLMTFAAWRIMRLSPTPERRNALILFWTQLALNVAWSWMFFAAHSPLLGLINIVPQLALVTTTCVAFWRLDRLAGLALVPLVAWVGYATALNAAIWWLNR